MLFIIFLFFRIHKIICSSQHCLKLRRAFLPNNANRNTDPFGSNAVTDIPDLTPVSYTHLHHVPKDHQKTEHICNVPQFFLRHYPSPFHCRINPSVNRILSFLYFTHKLPACKSILQKITLHNNIC